jgi:hypothetical protein
MKAPLFVLLILLHGLFTVRAGEVEAVDEADAKSSVMPPASGQLPPPWGFGLFYFGQERQYVVTDLSASIRGVALPGINAGLIERIENRVDQVNLKLDHWVFPWLNLHGILGTATGEAVAGLDPGLPLPVSEFVVGYDAEVYGGGVTLAAGGKHVFMSVTGDYTWGDVTYGNTPGLRLVDASGIETLIFTPKVGIYGDRGAVWVGAFYQRSLHVQTGAFSLPPFGAIDFVAEVEDKTNWTPVIGGEFYLNRHWSFMAELGLGADQTQGMTGVTYRF